MMEAHRAKGAMCGHGACAAALGVSVLEACALFPELAEGKRWVNVPMMKAAMGRAGQSWLSMGAFWPRKGVALIQWEGAWTKPGVPTGAACAHRHWVACHWMKLWDANYAEWLRFSSWRERVPEIMPPAATGWTLKRGYQIEPLRKDEGSVIKTASSVPHVGKDDHNALGGALSDGPPAKQAPDYLDKDWKGGEL